MQGLFVEELLYSPQRASLWHPDISDWHADDREWAEQLLVDLGDVRYYEAAKALFERQVAHYGGWEKLRLDTELFKKACAIVTRECSHLPDWLDDKENGPDGYHVQQKHVCHVATFRRLGLARWFGEDV